MNMKLKAIADQDNTIECNAMDNLKLHIKVFNNYVIGHYKPLHISKWFLKYGQLNYWKSKRNGKCHKLSSCKQNIWTIL